VPGETRSLWLPAQPAVAIQKARFSLNCAGSRGPHHLLLAREAGDRWNRVQGEALLSAHML